MDIWRKYNGAIIPVLPPHIKVLTSYDEIKKIMKSKSVFFARWTSDFDSKNKTEFWYIINDLPLYLRIFILNYLNSLWTILSNNLRFLNLSLLILQYRR